MTARLAWQACTHAARPATSEALPLLLLRARFCTGGVDAIEHKVWGLHCEAAELPVGLYTCGKTCDPERGGGELRRHRAPATQCDDALQIFADAFPFDDRLISQPDALAQDGQREVHGAPCLVLPARPRERSAPAQSGPGRNWKSHAVRGAADEAWGRGDVWQPQGDALPALKRPPRLATRVRDANSTPGAEPVRLPADAAAHPDAPSSTRTPRNQRKRRARGDEAAASPTGTGATISAAAGVPAVFPWLEGVARDLAHPASPDVPGRLLAALTALSSLPVAEVAEWASLCKAQFAALLTSKHLRGYEASAVLPAHLALQQHPSLAAPRGALVSVALRNFLNRAAALEEVYTPRHLEALCELQVR